jgi:hypothetical protein
LRSKAQARLLHGVVRIAQRSEYATCNAAQMGPLRFDLLGQPA